MRGLLTGTAVTCALTIAPAAAASDGMADSFCPRGDASRIEWEKIWRVTSDFDDRMRESIQFIPQGASFSHADARGMVDIALQNLARQSRAYVTMRVLENDHTCTFGSGGCVRALTDDEAPVECGIGDAGGYVQVGGNDVTICQENLASGWLPMTLEHEITHTYHLTHANDWVGDPCNDNPGCAASDGCDGELMCRGVCDNGWSYLTAADSTGLRTEYNGSTMYIDRAWNTGGANLPNVTGFAYDSPGISGHYAAFPPRIDCSEVATNPTNRCAVVALYQTSPTDTTLRITTLNGWTATTGWVNTTDVNDVVVASRFPPDITLIAGGATAYVVRTNSASITNNVQVRRVVLSTGATTTVSLGYATRLPPRIANLPGDAVLVLGARWDQPSRWQLHKISYNKTLGAFDTPVALDMGPLDNDTGGTDEAENNMIVSDFDFDCYSGSCVLAAVLHDSDETNEAAGYNVVQRRRFTVSGTTVTVPDPDWSRDDNGVRANAVIGVARGASRLYVSAGRAATSSVDASNTRVTEYDSDTAAAPSIARLQRSDTAGCVNHVTPLGTIPAATQHGGTSVSVCPGCNGGAGTLESVHMLPGPSSVCF